MPTRRFLALAILTILTGCGQQPVHDAAAPDLAAGYAREAESAAAPAAEAAEQTKSASSAETAPTGVRNRKMIYRASLAVEVRQLGPAVSQARQVVEQAGGYIAQLEQQGGQEARTASLVVKVPAARFDAVLDKLGTVGEVRNRTLETEDVSEQWVDLDARLRNKQREEERMLALLARAERMQDLLLIERELSRVRGEIEQLAGQLRHLNDQIALSQITVTLGLPAEIDATVNSQSWLRVTFSRAAATFVRLGKTVGALLIYLLVNSPFLLLPIGLVYLARRRRRRQ